jgi:hypothetical protein
MGISLSQGFFRGGYRIYPITGELNQNYPWSWKPLEGSIMADKKNNPKNTSKSGDGLYLDELSTGSVVELETQHHHYTLVKRGGDQVLISGHPYFCPRPINVQIEGSFPNLPISVPKPGFIGRGMYLLFNHPVYHSVTTSRIREIHKHG